MRRAWVLWVSVALATSGCSFGMRSPYGAKHQGECDTSYKRPITDAAISVASLGLGYALSQDECGLCGEKFIGGYLIFASIPFALASLSGVLKARNCRELPNDTVTQ